MKDELSVIIPIHNGSSFIIRVINSVREELPDASIILVENGSTDDSLAKLRKFESSHIHVLMLPTASKSKARNLGVQSATSKYITFLDQDDEIRHERYEVITYLETGECDVVIGTQKFVESEEKYIPPYFRKIMKGLRPMYCPMTMVISRENFLRISGFSENFSSAEDFEIMTRINAAGLRVKLINRCSLVRHFHEANDSRDIERSRRELFRLLRADTRRRLS